ncbi:unnamed protein product [Bursaphelenchus okinawaensis]|uniref:Uncharacterized protein n=1 Tax=Bursaphelenchus okinawaensis TaxID=465554 RepID=A0A811JVZ3_9BILA|nr:unnamed protein product [Bursaphelenchus okinawaensis]CAG9086300.1 unnamed protein product [Bursaphelenchus okinawaensis]
MSILWAIYPEFWIRMIKYTTNVEDRCSFAQINKYCYELTVRATKISFQSLCYRHMICRYKGETWATAKPKLTAKAKGMAKANAKANAKGKAKSKVHLINKSKQLLLDMVRTYVVYDIAKKKVVKTYPALQHQRYNNFTLWYSESRTLVDVCNQKEHKFNVNGLGFCKEIYNAVSYGYRKYVGFVNTQKQFVVINNTTGQRQTVFPLLDDGWDGHWDPIIAIADDSDLVVHKRGL